MVVEVGILGFGEAVAELEHPGPPVGTETHPEQAVSVFGRGRREAAASLSPIANTEQGSTISGADDEHLHLKETGVGTSVGHSFQAEVVEGTDVEHLSPTAVDSSGPWGTCHHMTHQLKNALRKQTQTDYIRCPHLGLSLDSKSTS